MLAPFKQQSADFGAAKFRRWQTKLLVFLDGTISIAFHEKEIEICNLEFSKSFDSTIQFMLDRELPGLFTRAQKN